MDSSDAPLVTVVTPSYNQGPFIEETLLSVKRQDYTHIDHLVIDGGSTDETLDILRRYEAAYPLRWISEPDRGQADALNKGFRRVQGEIIGWLNSDDLYMPETVSTVVRYFTDHPDVEWVYGDGYWMDAHNRVLYEMKAQAFDLKKLICEYQYITQATLFFRRRVLDVIGLLDITLSMAMDYDFLIRLGRHARAGYIPRVLAAFRLQPSSKTMTRAQAFGSDEIAILDRTFAEDGLPEEIVRARQTAYSNHLFLWGCRCFNAGNLREARGHLLRALRLDPVPWRQKNLSILLTLLQGFLGITWYRPVEYSIRKAEKSFQAEHGEIHIDWFRT